MRTSWICAAAAACALALSAAPAYAAAADDPLVNGELVDANTYDNNQLIDGGDALDDTMLLRGDLGLADYGPILVITADDGAYRALADPIGLQSPDIGDRISLIDARGLIDTDAITSFVALQAMRTPTHAAAGPDHSGALDDLANPAAGRFNSA